MVYFGVAGFAGSPDTISIARCLAAASGGILVLAGLWTPLVGALVAIDELWIASSQHLTQPDAQWTSVLVAVISVAVAMLGPGAWSVDAYLFGRKRFDLADQ